MESTIEQSAHGQTRVAAESTERPPGSGGQALDPPSPISISVRFLLGIYGILPLCLLAMILDSLFWGGSLSSVLPGSPQNFFIFQLIFGTPHIIASSVILVTNGDYFRIYRVRLILLTLVILLIFGAGSLIISYDVFLAIVGVVTILHVIKQQVGIGKGVCRVSGRVYDAWGWSLIALGSMIYFVVFSDQEFSPAATAWKHGVLWTLSALVVLLTVACHFRTATFKGRLYLWANATMVLQSGLFYSQGYAFLAILGPRLVHDLTAFTFYVTHDVNRHGAEPRNLLYRLARKLGLGIFWVCPALAVLLTYLIGRFADPLAQLVVTPVIGFDLPYAASFLIVGYLGLLHYYSEALTWRRGSAYRQHIAITP